MNFVKEHQSLCLCVGIIIIVIAVYFLFFMDTGENMKNKSTDIDKLYKKFHDKFKNGISKKKFIEKSDTNAETYLAIFQLYAIARIFGLDPDKEITTKEYHFALENL
jgi:hypothetical protein